MEVRLRVTLIFALVSNAALRLRTVEFTRPQLKFIASKTKQKHLKDVSNLRVNMYPYRHLSTSKLDLMQKRRGVAANQ